jgi:16S rRNA C1402 (ribose-2'-O) methylase RsmI
VVVFYEAPHRIAATLGELLVACPDAEAMVARELTKAHEEILRGPLSAIVNRLNTIKGEFVVVLDIGQKPNISRLDGDNAPAGRRAALAQLAAEHGLTANQLYKAIQDIKNRSIDQIERSTDGTRP